MTDNNIIKSLEICIVDKPCDGCPYTGRCRWGKSILQDALSLINRQKAEIEALQDVNIRLTKAEAIKEFADRLKEEFLDDERIVNMAWVNAINHIDNLVKEMVGDGQ